MELRGKKVLLTGADGGIGSAVSRELARAGCSLVLCSHQASGLEKLAKELAAEGHTGSVKTVTVDLSHTGARQRLVDECAALGGIDVLVNLAGILDFRLFENQPAEIIERTLVVNMLAPMLLCKDFLPQLQQKAEQD